MGPVGSDVDVDSDVYQGDGGVEVDVATPASARTFAMTSCPGPIVSSFLSYLR